MTSGHRAYIALGSNLGDRLATLHAAQTAIEQLPGTSIEARSSVVETAPVGPPGQGPYLNAAVQIGTSLSPQALLAALLRIERALGRNRSREQRWGARTIDLDILFFDELILEVPGLTLPHPRCHERRFVLEPLCEIAPELVHPVLQRCVSDLLGQCSRPTGIPR